MRFGLNPVMDLIPVVGDGAAAVISALTMFVAARIRFSSYWVRVPLADVFKIQERAVCYVCHCLRSDFIK